MLSSEDSLLWMLVRCGRFAGAQDLGARVRLMLEFELSSGSFGAWEGSLSRNLYAVGAVGVVRFGGSWYERCSLCELRWRFLSSTLIEAVDASREYNHIRAPWS